MAKFISDNYLNSFAKNLNKEVSKFRSPKANRDEMFEQQKIQLQKLYDLENEFKKILQEDPYGDECIVQFCDYILNIRRNTLSARPFFKERSKLMTEVGPAIKEHNIDIIYKYHMNYNLIKFITLNCSFKSHALYKICEDIGTLRNEIVICNLPLAINRAKIFFSKTPKSHLDYLDLIQISAAGLYSAIDKYVPPFTHSFKSVIIGRIVGEFIEEYSQTMLHFFPYDKKKLYNANKIAHKFREKEVDYEALTDELNKTGILGQNVSVYEISDILLAASHVSSDIPKKANNPTISHDQELLSIERFPDTARRDPETSLIEDDTRKALYGALNKLSLLEEKVIRIKGGLDF